MRPESTSVSFRADLSAFAQEYNEKMAATYFIGDRVAPIFETDECSGHYPIMKRENFKKPANTKRTSRGAYNRIQGEFGRGTYDCEENGLEYPVDDAMRRKYAGLFKSEKAAVRILNFQLLMARERRVASLFSGGGFTNTNVSTAWSTSASAVPLDDIATGINTLSDKCGVAKQDVGLIIPRADFQEMVQTDQVNDKIKYTYPGSQPALLKPTQVAAMLEIGQVLVPAGVYDSTEEGVAETNTQIWTAGVCYLVVLCQAKDDLEVPGAARTILWTADSPTLPVTESYRDDEVRADVVRSREHTDEVLIGETDLFVYKLTNT